MLEYAQPGGGGDDGQNRHTSSGERAHVKTEKGPMGLCNGYSRDNRRVSTWCSLGRRAPGAVAGCVLTHALNERLPALLMPAALLVARCFSCMIAKRPSLGQPGAVHFHRLIESLAVLRSGQSNKASDAAISDVKLHEAVNLS